MKILCDVCKANEASVLCCADEAALCSACDRRVHRANNLAGKHRRLSLISHPRPLCDICKERPGFVFCKEDRAILCHECDFSIHNANGLAMKHGRFILAGARLSSASVSPFSPLVADESSSSISEYLIKTLPGYRFEDFLFDDCVNHVAGDVFNQSDALAPLADRDLDADDIADSVKESSNKETIATSDCAEQCTAEEVFAVPQLTSVAGSIKRPFGTLGWDF